MIENQKLEQEYPCLWEYKIIGTDESEIREAIACVVAEREHIVTFSKTSSKGSYVSLNLELVVSAEEDRDTIYSSLKTHTAVKIVL